MRLSSDGTVDGGTVVAPSEYWNPCVTTLDHKGTTYEGVTRPHDKACDTLVGRGWGVYLKPDGTIVTNSAEQMIKAVVSVLVVVVVVTMVREVSSVVLLFSNNFYRNYALPSVFESDLGERGKSFHKWWTVAYKADKREECIRLFGDMMDAAGMDTVARVSDVAGDVAGTAQSITESLALAYLKSMADSENPVATTTTTTASSLGGERVTNRFSHRPVRTAWAVSYGLVRHHVFTQILKVEEGNDRPVLDHVLVIVASLVIAVVFRQYASSSSTRRGSARLQKKVLDHLPRGGRRGTSSGEASRGLTTRGSRCNNSTQVTRSCV